MKRKRDGTPTKTAVASTGYSGGFIPTNYYSNHTCSCFYLVHHKVVHAPVPKGYRCIACPLYRVRCNQCILRHFSLLTFRLDNNVCNIIAEYMQDLREVCALCSCDRFRFNLSDRVQPFRESALRESVHHVQIRSLATIRTFFQLAHSTVMDPRRNWLLTDAALMEEGPEDQLLRRAEGETREIRETPSISKVKILVDNCDMFCYTQSQCSSCYKLVHELRDSAAGLLCAQCCLVFGVNSAQDSRRASREDSDEDEDGSDTSQASDQEAEVEEQVRVEEQIQAEQIQAEAEDQDTSDQDESEGESEDDEKDGETKRFKLRL